MRGRTTIAVAHRMSTIQRADFIIVLDEGRIAEMGSQSELLLKRELYFEMVKIQSLGRLNRLLRVCIVELVSQVGVLGTIL